MRGKGINYDTGFIPGGHLSRPLFDPAQAAKEMRVIARDLHCTAVRITGGDPARLEVAGRLAAAAGLEVWFAPFPCELSPEENLAMLAECAGLAEGLRQSGAEVVFVAGCELSLFGTGFVPGAAFSDRIGGLGRVDLSAVCARLSDFLGAAAAEARTRFGGKITYAAGPWEEIDWTPFDIVAVDGYRGAENRAYFDWDIRRRFRHGVLSKTSLGLSKDQEVTSSVEHPFVARHLGNTVGLGNKRCGKEKQTCTLVSFV